jgi:hypothetical protein
LVYSCYDVFAWFGWIASGNMIQSRVGSTAALASRGDAGGG